VEVFRYKTAPDNKKAHTLLIELRETNKKKYQELFLALLTRGIDNLIGLSLKNSKKNNFRDHFTRFNQAYNIFNNGVNINNLQDLEIYLSYRLKKLK
jgi:hypothetical protein